MDGFYLLAALSIAVFFGSFLAGLIPLVFVMTEGRTRLLSTFGAGLLVGTALSVIIPEGVESLYLSFAERHSPRSIQMQDALNPHQFVLGSHLVSNQSVKNNNEDDIGKTKQAPRSLVVNEGGNEGYRNHEHSETKIDITAIGKPIGYSLVTGFIFMLIVDQISQSALSKGSTRHKMTATIGLIVHAAADGIALGSASATKRTNVQFIVFFAVMLHKAPAAFGLVSFLLVEGVERFRIRRHLIAFSIAAPLAALVTYYLIVAVGSESLTADSATGALMLFSAGTFLYVATVHILAELVNPCVGGGYQLVNSAVEGSGRGYGGSRPSLTYKELISIVVGAILPTILASGHSH